MPHPPGLVDTPGSNSWPALRGHAGTSVADAQPRGGARGRIDRHVESAHQRPESESIAFLITLRAPIEQHRISQWRGPGPVARSASVTGLAKCREPRAE